jgi:hypothetical protein
VRADDDERRIRLFCPRGEGVDACAFSRRLSTDGLPILHLISGAVGTTVGLFEAAVDELSARTVPSPSGPVPAGPVIVASTATTKRADPQVKALYGRRRSGWRITLYNWSRPRDLAHFEDFEHYHATFYRQVEALSVTPYSRRSLDRGTAATMVAAVRHVELPWSVNAAACRVPLDGELVEEVVDRLLARAELAGGEQGRDYLAERLGRLRDAWSAKQGGDYALGYETRRDKHQTIRGPVLVLGP